MSNKPPKNWLYQPSASTDEDDSAATQLAPDMEQASHIELPEQDKEAIRGALAQLRKKLLDLTAHNPLISYTHGKSSRYIRIVDELPDNLTEHLYNGRQLTFSPVPEPDPASLTEWKAQNQSSKEKRPKAQEWAAHFGINPSPDLPETAKAKNSRKFQDQSIQTAYYPEVLEARLGIIKKLSRTAVEETGMNFLHLAFGFLEWYESEDSEKTRHAPLYSIPVNLERGSIDKETNTYQYTLSLSSGDVQFNASLAARLIDDFGYVLPELNEDTWPEDYLKTVERSISSKFPRWKVRRWGTLALFNFGRLLMYRDLDPDTWPQGEGPDTHRLVNAVIAGESRLQENGDASRDAQLLTEHSIDEIDDIHERYPLVDVADSSQHSALIDALDGKNLVIQGPPGTGKSQTITNLIAAAMHQGKTVLFVSEKMAALDVVRQRMGRLKLGHFCLELHSHATHKTDVVESLRQRLSANFPAPRAIEEQIRNHTQLQSQLSAHAQRVNKIWKNTGKTIHEILAAAVRCRADVPEKFLSLRITPIDGSAWDPVQTEMLEREIRTFHKQTAEIAADLNSRDFATAHPWRGVTSTDLDALSCNILSARLSQWKESLAILLEHTRSLANLPDFRPESMTCNSLAALAETASMIPSTDGRVFWDSIVPLRTGQLGVLDDLLERVASMQTRSEEIGSLALPELLEYQDFPQLTSAIDSLLASGFRASQQISELASIKDACLGLKGEIQKWTDYLGEFSRYANSHLPGCVQANSLTLGSLRELERLVATSSNLPGSLRTSRSKSLLASGFGTKLDKLSKSLESLRARRSKLSAVFKLEATRNVSQLSGLRETLSPDSLMRRLFSSDYRRAKQQIKALLKDPDNGWDPHRIQNQLADLIDYLRQEEEFNNCEEWQVAFGALYRGMDSNLQDIRCLIQWHSLLARDFTQKKGGLFEESDLSDSGQWLLEAPADLLERLPKFLEAGLKQAIQTISDNLQVFDSAGLLLQTAETEVLADADGKWEESLRSRVSSIERLGDLSSVVAAGDHCSLAGVREKLQAYVDLVKEFETAKSAYDAINARLFAKGLPAHPLPIDPVHDCIAPTRTWCEWFMVPHPEHLKVLEIFMNPSLNAANSFRAWGRRLDELLADESTARQAFFASGKIEEDCWSKEGTVDSLLDRANEALSRVDLLSTFGDYLRIREKLHAFGLADFAARIENEPHSVQTVTSAYQHAYMASLADEILSMEPQLSKFNGIRQSEARRDYAKCDRTISELMRRKLASRIAARNVPQGFRGTKVADHTELELLKNEINKQTRHIPIRQLLKRAGRAVQALMPCFMMGPRSVAQYLAPGELRFDLLVIDEASQMRPSDALGAVARCRQLVVVGDSKQLAPSSFFERIDGTEEEAEDQYEAAVAESILDAVSPVFRNRPLRWHYRSRHESLIAFSNLQFYKNNMMLFPSPHLESDELGIRYFEVADGVLQDQTNRPEAEAVAARVEELLLENPLRSLGIATMNAKQRDLIERLIESRAKKNDKFGSALSKNSGAHEPLFVKNLENVQGDEREVMLISCTYGKDHEAGKVHQRFGPINSADGWRRLNVLFTRSRVRMEIFSSMHSSDIRVDEMSSEGVRALHGMLHYAETKKLKVEKPAGRDADSDFEIAVARRFLDLGFDVDCQIGVAGFFIDLAIKDPKRPDRYLIGIECDGATYHSGKSVRDRDRLRQEILENMGWTIYRIWSTDWFHNPDRAIRPILQELGSFQAH